MVIWTHVLMKAGFGTWVSTLGEFQVPVTDHQSNSQDYFSYMTIAHTIRHQHLCIHTVTNDSYKSPRQILCYQLKKPAGNRHWKYKLVLWACRVVFLLILFLRFVRIYMHVYQLYQSWLKCLTVFYFSCAASSACVAAAAGRTAECDKLLALMPYEVTE